MQGKRAQTPPPKKKKRRRSPLGRAFTIFYRTLVILSAIIVTGAIVWNFTVRPPAVAGTPETTPPPFTGKTPGQSGADQQGGSSEDIPVPGQKLERKELFYTVVITCVSTDGGTDTMMVASYDIQNQKASLVSIPRDTLVARTTADGNYYSKINAAYGVGGGEELKAAISDYLGIPIDYYVVFNLKGIAKVIDQIGGIDFYVPCNMNYDDPVQDLSIHYKEGMYYGLTGQQVMEIGRYRDDNYDPELGYQPSGYSNYALGRDETARNLMKAVSDKLLSWQSLTKITSLYDTVAKNVKTDMSAGDIAYFASAALGIKDTPSRFDMGADLSSSSLPGNSDFKYKGVRYYFRADTEECLAIINSLLNPYTTPVTAEMANLTPVG